MDSFKATSNDGRLIAYLYRDPPAEDNISVRGWCFVVEERSSIGEYEPVFDTWEETAEEILRYLPVYIPAGSRWVAIDTGAQVDVFEAVKGAI